MTRRVVVFHPGVEDDLAAIYAHFEQFDPALLSRFEARLDEQVELIGMFPESGVILFESYRRVLLKRFPYMAVYLVGANRIDVLAIVAVRRDPARPQRRGFRPGQSDSVLQTTRQVVRRRPVTLRSGPRRSGGSPAPGPSVRGDG